MVALGHLENCVEDDCLGRAQNQHSEENGSALIAEAGLYRSFSSVMEVLSNEGCPKINANEKCYQSCLRASKRANKAGQT